MKFIRLTHTPDGYACTETSLSGNHKPGLHGYGKSKIEALLGFCRNAGVEIPDAASKKILLAKDTIAEDPSRESEIANVFRDCEVDLRFIEKGKDDVTFWAVNSMTFDLAPWDEATDDGSRIRISVLPMNSYGSSSLEIVSRTIVVPDGPSAGRTSIILENQGNEGPRSGLAVRVHPLEQGGFPFYDDNLAGCTDEPQVCLFTNPEKPVLTAILGEKNDCFKIEDGDCDPVKVSDLYPAM